MSAKFFVSGVFELAGFGAIVAGCSLIALWLGLIVGGLMLIAMGWAIDPPNRARRPAAVLPQYQVAGEGISDL